MNLTSILEAKESTKRALQTITLDGLNELIEISNIVARNTPEEYRMVAEDVLSKAFRRTAYLKLEQCQKMCLEDDKGDLGQKIYETIDSVILDYHPNNDLPLFGTVVDKVWESIEARQRGETNAIEFPFPALNEYAVMEPGEVICFSAAQKAGKSAMLLSCTVEMLRKGKSVLYIDSELSTKLFTQRIFSHLSGVPFSVIRSGKYSEEQRRRIENAKEWLKDKKFVHLYTPVLDENTLLLTCKRAKRLMDIDCVVLDYLKPAGATEAFAVYAELGLIADCFKNRVCGELNICGLTAAQATSAGKIADSARIARSVSTVISIMDKTRDEIRMDGEACGNKKLRVMFNRNGAQMSDDEYIDLEFEGSILTYRQAIKQHDPNAPY